MIAIEEHRKTDKDKEIEKTDRDTEIEDTDIGLDR
jgi:hypothetical protein